MLSLNNPAVTKFSEREIQVLKLIIDGKTNSKIAGELNISPLTVKTHRQNLLRKLNARNAAQMVAEAGLKRLL